MSKIDIIVPVYNAENYIEDLIQSILTQSFQDYTLILVDDASTDKSREICDRYSLVDERIKVIHHGVNQGVGVSRDDGYRLGVSEWISFVDSDDILLPDFLSKLVRLINPEVDVCGCRVEIMESKQNIGPTGDDVVQYFSGEEMLYKIFTAGKGEIGEEVLWSKIIRRELIEKFIGELREKKKLIPRTYFNDYSFSVRLWHYCRKASYLDKRLYAFRVSCDSLSHIKAFTEHRRQLIMSYADGIEFLESNSDDITLRRQVLDCCVIISEFYYMMNMVPCDEALRSRGEQTIEDFMRDNNKHLSIKSVYNYKKLFAYVSVKVFSKNKKVWLGTIGRLLYGRKFRQMAG